ncbi:hypothetical protein T06_16147 [Trichinella sp. T6]|nr:hypothetical protein T06_16147 [Trichinella sp. T6]
MNFEFLDPPSNKLPCSWSISDVIYVSWFGRFSSSSLQCCSDFYQRFCLRDLHKQHFVTCPSCSKGTSCGIILIFSRRNACTPCETQHNLINLVFE